jgi:hypothetical protein
MQFKHVYNIGDVIVYTSIYTQKQTTCLVLDNEDNLRMMILSSPYSDSNWTTGCVQVYTDANNFDFEIWPKLETFKF